MYALIIKDEKGLDVVNHISKWRDDTCTTHREEIPENINKAHHFVDWVKKNRPDWKIYERKFEIEINITNSKMHINLS